MRIIIYHSCRSRVLELITNRSITGHEKLNRLYFFRDNFAFVPQWLQLIQVFGYPNLKLTDLLRFIF